MKKSSVLRRSTRYSWQMFFLFDLFFRSWNIVLAKSLLGGGFKYVSSLFGEMIQFDYIIFFRWVVQPPTRRVQVLGSQAAFMPIKLTSLLSPVVVAKLMEGLDDSGQWKVMLHTWNPKVYP